MLLVCCESSYKARKNHLTALREVPGSCSTSLRIWQTQNQKEDPAQSLDQAFQTVLLHAARSYTFSPETADNIHSVALIRMENFIHIGIGE